MIEKALQCGSGFEGDLALFTALLIFLISHMRFE
jgi:hypothetical protein